jgi:hypothetical protein
MTDIFYNILLHVNSVDFKNITSINNDTRKIVKSKQFWIDKFNMNRIPIIDEPNFEEFQRYEKCQSIVNGVITLMERDSHLGDLAIMSFNQENIIQYLPVEMIDDMKEYINEDEDILNEIPSSVLKELDYTENTNIKLYKQTLFFSLSYDDNKLQPNISYSLLVDKDHLLEADTFCSLDFIKKLLTDMIYIFPYIKLKDSNDISYLPDIIYDKYYLNDTSQIRDKYWRNKQWYL